tara:strand:- start:252 stop:722 length:471 start_codon:yes stop_codon:yes gene_type:complete
MGSSLIIDNSFENLKIESLKIGVVQSEWNSNITDMLMSSCINYFLELGIKKNNLIIRKVPGSMELVYGSDHMFQNHNVDGIVALGCIIKGETDHDKYIAGAISNGILSVSLKNKKPISFGVLTTNNIKQAIARSGGNKGDKGMESAYTLLKMLNLN